MTPLHKIPTPDASAAIWIRAQAEMEDGRPSHPAQPLVTDTLGVVRFKANAAVKKLLSVSQTWHTFGLNELACDPDIPREDHVQLAQLIGYSLSGFGELSYVSDEDYERASTPPPAAPATDARARLQAVSDIAHYGGLAGLDADAAMDAIRGLTLPEFRRSATVQEAGAFVRAALTQAVDNSRCKFASGGARCVSHCGDPVCLGSES